MRVSVTHRSFCGPITKTQSQLRQIEDTLVKTAHLIADTINFASAKENGDPTDWQTIYYRLIDYSVAVAALAKPGVSQVNQEFSGPYAGSATGKVETNLYPTVHSMFHGTAKCGLAGRPHEWPKDHIQGQKGEPINCKGCIQKMDDALLKKTT